MSYYKLTKFIQIWKYSFSLVNIFTIKAHDWADDLEDDAYDITASAHAPFLLRPPISPGRTTRTSAVYLRGASQIGRRIGPCQPPLPEPTLGHGSVTSNHPSNLPL